jgi:hypothetical protein
MRLFVGIALAAACVAAPAFAAEGDNVAPEKKDRVVCKREQRHELGSHMRAPKVCMKQSDWDELAMRTQRDLRRLQGKGIDPTPIPGAR